MTSLYPSPFTSPALATDPAKLCAGLVLFQGDSTRSTKSRSRTLIYVSYAFIGFTFIVPQSANNDIAVSVAIYIAGTGYIKSQRCQNPGYLLFEMLPQC